MIRAVIIHADREMRRSIGNSLVNYEGFDCTGAFPDVQSGLVSICEAPPDVVLIDINYSNASGIRDIRLIKEKIPDLNVIVFTDLLDEENIFRAFEAGATGYLSSNSFQSELFSAIKEVLQGGAPMSHEVARKVVASFRKADAKIPQLSEREQTVLNLLSEGHSYNEMAEQLFVSTNTIRFHLKNIYKKLNVNSRHEAVAKASNIYRK